MFVHTAGQPLECFVNKIVLHKSPLLDERGNPQLDENGKPRYLCGFRIAGGIDQDNTKSPQGYSDKGIYVTHVNSGSEAEKAGLKANDKILQVNGHDMTMVTHKKAVDYITRKQVLEMFVHRPTDKNDGHHQSNLKSDGRLNNLENQMNKINVRNNSDQQDFERNVNYKSDLQGPYQPQPLPRNQYFNDGEPRTEGDYAGQYVDDRQSKQDDFHAQQQKYSQRNKQPGEWGDGRNLENHHQKQQNPLKPPRWQQYSPTEQQRPHQQIQRDFNPEQNKLQQVPQNRNYNTGRDEQNQNTYDNQTGRSNLNDYRQEPQVFRHGGPSYSHPVYQAQHHGNAGDDRNPNNQQPSSYIQQQRSYGVSQQRPSDYIPDKRSTQPYSSNYSNQKLY